MLRGMFSLVGLLVTMAIIAWVWSSYTSSVVKEGHHAEEMAQSVAGNAPDGTRAIDSVSLEPEDVNGQFNDLLVKSVVPDGIMEKYYGLKAGDKIEGVDALVLKDYDSGAAMAYMQEAYMRKQALSVIRDGQRIRLPSDSAPAAPGSPADIQRSLERIPTH